MGSTDAMVYLASMFEAGELGTKDLSRALACYQMAADKDEPRAIEQLKRLDSHGPEPIKASHCI